jgi:hypothetical protein
LFASIVAGTSAAWPLAGEPGGDGGVDMADIIAPMTPWPGAGEVVAVRRIDLT